MPFLVADDWQDPSFQTLAEFLPLEVSLSRLEDRPGALVVLVEPDDDMLLGKATRALGDVRLVDLRSEEICAWQRTLPDGHRFEATQALRQVLNRAVAWELIEINPAKRGVDNPLRLSSAGSCAAAARLR